MLARGGEEGRAAHDRAVLRFAGPSEAAAAGRGGRLHALVYARAKCRHRLPPARDRGFPLYSIAESLSVLRRGFITRGRVYRRGIVNPHAPPCHHSRATPLIPTLP